MYRPRPQQTRTCIIYRSKTSKRTHSAEWSRKVAFVDWVVVCSEEHLRSLYLCVYVLWMFILFMRFSIQYNTIDEGWGDIIYCTYRTLLATEPVCLSLGGICYSKLRLKFLYTHKRTVPTLIPQIFCILPAVCIFNILSSPESQCKICILFAYFCRKYVMLIKYKWISYSKFECVSVCVRLRDKEKAKAMRETFA